MINDCSFIPFEELLKQDARAHKLTVSHSETSEMIAFLRSDEMAISGKYYGAIYMG